MIALPIGFLAVGKIGSDGVLPALSIALYVGTALIPLLSGRLGLGVDQASSSRYATAGALAPLGIYFCALGLARTRRRCRYLVAAMIVLMALGIVNSYWSGITMGTKERQDRIACAAGMRDLKHIDRRRTICGYPDPGVVIDRTPVLQRDHLSLFEQ